MNFRVVFSPNGLEPFISLQQDYKSAVANALLIAAFDLGAISVKENPLLRAYQAYRRKNGINHPDLISFSTCSIEQKDENGKWWIVSESLEYEPDFTIEDEMEGYPG